jgi:hypothetical protein
MPPGIDKQVKIRTKVNGIIKALPAIPCQINLPSIVIQYNHSGTGELLSCLSLEPSENFHI